MTAPAWANHFRFMSLLFGCLALGLATSARALDGGPDVPRMVSFGGTCRNCELSGRKLTGAKFVGANFSGASLTGCDLRARHSPDRISMARIWRKRTSAAPPWRARDLLANFADASLAGLEARGVEFTNANFNRAVFIDAELEGANLTRVDARGAIFTGANLTGATLSSGRFEGASFQGARLTAANLSDGAFADADLKNAEMVGATLSGADLANAHNLTQRQIALACADPRTRLPPGLHARPCLPRPGR